jgi:hypothetical protein
MDQSKVHKWSIFLFLVPSSLALAYFVFYLATFTPSYANTHANIAQVGLTSPACADKIILVKGQTQTIGGKVELTYQGLDTGYVVIDITLLDLDRHYAYRSKYNINVIP